MKCKLSPRQLEVVELLSWDWSPKEIAKYLDISKETLRVHVGEGLRRTHTHTRAGLVAMCLRKRWIK